jgi:hypothetical protein
MVNAFDTAAWYLLLYSGTLSFSEWRKTVKQVYKELEQQYGTNNATKVLNKMVAYYCLEIGQSYRDRKAISKFRKVHTWQDFRESDNWWIKEWNDNKKQDKMVQEIRSKLIELPSIAPEDIEDDDLGREALRVLLLEAEFRKQGEVDESVFRALISIYGGYSILQLYRDGTLRSRAAIPSILGSYFIEKSLVQKYGEALLDMKIKGGE